MLIYSSFSLSIFCHFDFEKNRFRFRFDFVTVFDFLRFRFFGFHIPTCYLQPKMFIMESRLVCLIQVQDKIGARGYAYH